MEALLGFLAAVLGVIAAIISRKKIIIYKRETSPEARVQPVTSEQTADRTKVEWLSNIVVTILLGLFYISSVSSACSNDDILALSALIGLPLSALLIFQNRPYRIVWILAPLISFLIGLPYGHNYGTMTKSPLFGLEQGTKCQSGPEVLIILGVVIIVAVIEHAVFLHTSKR